MPPETHTLQPPAALPQEAVTFLSGRLADDGCSRGVSRPQERVTAPPSLWWRGAGMRRRRSRAWRARALGRVPLSFEEQMTHK